ncbi:hypothetical protein [Polyangium sp. y55x31]|uniref:hypothetical protein n=1 Tax=Polyangium sp. y55x31 TaxID=3042688 RepID=UPI0024830A7C|nr:hypothetical protein [Polyangium sp. y55x31]MDI1480655.1 hypothetical protein [Polyangium sp. y55x31]
MSNNRSFLVLGAASMIILGAEPALASGEVELVYAEATTWLKLPTNSVTAPSPDSGFAGTNDLGAAPMLAALDLDTFALEPRSVPLLSLFPPKYRYYFEIAVSTPISAGTVTVQIPTSSGLFGCAANYATLRGDGRALYTANCYPGPGSVNVSVQHKDFWDQTHVDDNFGLGHAVSYAAGPTMPGGRVFHHGVPRASNTMMQGAAVLANLPPDATVTVVYSKDDWTTATTFPAVVGIKGLVGSGGFPYGTNPAIDGTTVHTFSLPDVTSKISYYFVVESSLGSFTDDNEGAYYEFEP